MRILVPAWILKIISIIISESQRPFNIGFQERVVRKQTLSETAVIKPNKT